MNRFMTVLEHINNKNNVWSLVFLCLLLLGSFADTANAGINQWTPIGPEGGSISALAIDPSNPTTLYAGTYGGIFKSTNAGASWQSVNTGLTNLNVLAIAIDPLTPTTLYAGTGGGIFKSINGGASWQAANTGLTNLDVLALVIDPVTPTTLYAGSYFGGGVSKSINGGASWQSVNTGLANLSVIALAIDPSNPAMVYAGTNGGGVFKITFSEGGVGAAIDLSSTALATGDQTIGTRVLQEVIVTNTGTANLLLDPLTLTGANAADFVLLGGHCFGANLAPGSHCWFDVVFEPTAISANTAVVNIPSNAPGSPHAVMISGNGVTEVFHPHSSFPVVFVHGTCADHMTWKKVFNNLVGKFGQGWRYGGLNNEGGSEDIERFPAEVDLYMFDFDDPLIQSGLTDWGSQLRLFLSRINLHRMSLGAPSTKFIIVAHSAGGLAARSYLQSPEYNGDILHLITYGTPHLGIAGLLEIWLAPFALPNFNQCTNFDSADVKNSQGIQDMSPFPFLSEFLSTINSQGFSLTPTASTVKHTSLIGVKSPLCNTPLLSDCIVDQFSQT